MVDFDYLEKYLKNEAFTFHLDNLQLNECYRIIRSTDEVHSLTAFLLVEGIDILQHLVDTIPEDCFAETDLTSIIIPEHIKYIDTSAFEQCYYLEHIQFNDMLEEIRPFAFSNCHSLKEIIISNKISTIEVDAFSYCSELENVVLSDNVSKIDNSAFRGCTKLNNINLPENITYIGPYAFADCRSLFKMSYKSTIKEFISKVKVHEAAFRDSPLLRIKCIDGELKLRDFGII